MFPAPPRSPLFPYTTLFRSAYNAALGDALPRPVAHPLFTVCYEWPVAVALRERAISAAIAPLSVHATHELVIHRPPRDRKSTRLNSSHTVISYAVFCLKKKK